VAGKFSKDDDDENNPDNPQRYDERLDAPPGKNCFDA
jgi:hypothetical protein